MSHEYALRYELKIEDDGYTKDQAEDKGLTDCLLVLSILLPETGEYSQAIVASFNGKEKRPLTQKEIFKVYMMLGLSLHDQGELAGWQKDFVEVHANMIRSLFNHSKDCATQKK